MRARYAASPRGYASAHRRLGIAGAAGTACRLCGGTPAGRAGRWRDALGDDSGAAAAAARSSGAAGGVQRLADLADGDDASQNAVGVHGDHPAEPAQAFA